MAHRAAVYAYSGGASSPTRAGVVFSISEITSNTKPKANTMSKLTKIQLVQANTILADDNAALRAQLATALLDLAIANEKLELAHSDIVAITGVATALNTMAAPAGFWDHKRAAKQAATTPTAEGDKVAAPVGFWDHKKQQRSATSAYVSKPFARTPAQEAARNAAMASGKTTAVA